MKKYFYPIYLLILIVIGTWVYLYSGLEPILINLIVINIVIYLIRVPLINLVGYIVRKRVIQVFLSAVINIIWGFFIFMLIFVISTALFIAIISYILVAISFTLKDIINNITAGAIMLTSEQFELGDLIETNDIQGIVKNVDLSHTRLREFDGVSVILPNNIVYGSKLVKFSHERYGMIKEEADAHKIENEKAYMKYMKKLEKLISEKEKVTRYVKTIEILDNIPPTQLYSSLNAVFDVYEAKFDYRPEFAIDITNYGRIRIFLYLISDNATDILTNFDAFLRDISYEIYSDRIFEGWEAYKDQKINLKVNKGGVS
ncbi:MAG: mechanosensitive ion channel [Candidatus Lokiarchaeota archaeon]|nr:mechanosensitive ion channel [Candidatus Lokiarchaeota archaeon]MBD3343392.1 mechanosensitive ion channel [Candidatus Lokiarchaeota archaeon]